MSRISDQEIADFISKTILDGRQVSTTQELLLSGILDSLGVMTLVAFLETEMKIQIPTEKITFENFSSVEQVSGFLNTI
ncbi:phosphopantetheine-binding protein [Ruegeria arenilitoris]|uniref:phosphopantetheine-binding protein n=1 Tax=Ruegeria arenilitoris TaxID=1173585 RepID=UPI00147CA8F1